MARKLASDRRSSLRTLDWVAVTSFLGLIPLILGLLRSTDRDVDLDLGVAPLLVHGNGEDENCWGLDGLDSRQI